MKKAVVTGSGGFIGHHLVRFLRKKGYYVRGIDVKNTEFEEAKPDEFIQADLRDPCSIEAFNEADEIYALACDVGGVGYLSNSHFELFRNNININLNTLEGALRSNGKKLLFVSSACIYPAAKQEGTIPLLLKEDDIYPVSPENAYGLEKLTSEFMFISSVETSGLDLRIVRPQNVYGTEDLFKGGKEKAIGALCYKVATANQDGTVEIWGDGKQTRSFCFVEDIVEGFYLLMQSNYKKPINISTDGMVSIDEVVDILNKISGKNLTYRHNLNGAQGVRGRQSDTSLMKSILNWEPSTSLQEGLEKTYNWVRSQV